MRKIINITIIFVICILCFLSSEVYSTSITIDEIVNKFNTSSIVDDYKNAGGSIKATKESNSIKVELNLSGKTENVEMLLNGNILSIEIDKTEENALGKVYVTLSTIDIIGQLHGYKEGELSKTINSEEATKYTIDNEGYEMEEISTNKFKIKVDITKKIPLADFSNIYIEVADLENLKEYISGDGSVEKSKGNIWFNKSGYDGEYTLLLAEKGDLTENTYKSLLSILEVMFNNDKVIDYFKTNYPNISSGDKEFKGFNIKVNPKDKTEWEEDLIPSDSGYKFMRITIDKELSISSSTGTNKVENVTSDKNNSQTQTGKKLDIDTLPKTGEEINVFLIVLYIVVGICSVALVTLVIMKKKRN